jgi:hypothetical protein
VVPLPPDEAFAFVSDPRDSPLFIESIRTAEAGPGWGTVGGHARMVSAMLGRTFESDLELTVWDPPREFRYTMRQRGRPELAPPSVGEEWGGWLRLPSKLPGAQRGALEAMDQRTAIKVLLTG